MIVAYFERLLLLLAVSRLLIWTMRADVPCGTGHRYIEAFGTLPLLVVVFCCRSGLLIYTSRSVIRLNIILWQDLIGLWRVALVLCIVLVNLSLRVLWYRCLVGGGGICVIALTGGRVLISVSIVRHGKCLRYRRTP